jgi:hypothetical protein
MSSNDAFLNLLDNIFKLPCNPQPTVQSGPPGPPPRTPRALRTDRVASHNHRVCPWCGKVNNREALNCEFCKAPLYS